MEKNSTGTCLTCFYLSRSVGRGNRFIYFCKQWQLESEKWIPFGVVKSALGKPCPFYQRKQLERTHFKEIPEEKKDFDIFG